MTTPQLDALDAAYEEFARLSAEVASYDAAIRSEASTRFKIIDRVLTKVLGWRHDSIEPEEQAGEGFADYALSIDGVNRLIVEAKRGSSDFELYRRDCGGSYKLSGPAISDKELRKGMQQAINYSAHKNAELACVTNGFEWLVFRSIRVGDTTEPLDGKGFVFGSLQCISGSFSLFYDLLARDRVKGLTFRALFQEAEGRVIRHPAFAKLVRPITTAHWLPQPEVVPELDRLMTRFFQRMTDENDREMIEFCFVETRESRAAEQNLVRIAEDLVGRIKALDTVSGDELVELIERANKAGSKQFVIVVGMKGSGKSAFIDRFFATKIPRPLKENLVVVSVDVGKSEGDEQTIFPWLRQQLLNAAEAAVGSQAPTWDELIGHMFFAEYQRWSQTTMVNLYKKDKDAFKVEFGNHIERLRREKPVEYLRGLLKNFVAARKRLPVLVIDNADHFSIDFQQQVFQFARSIFEQELCIVVMPITDKTSWQLARDGALQSFESEALLLPTPLPKKVLEKRINFVLKKMEDDSKHERGEYFVGKGIKVTVADLMKFVRGLQEVFLNTKSTSTVLGQLTNMNIRDLLELSRDVINSPHVGLDEAFKAYVTGTSIHVQDFKIRNALLRGRYDIHVGSSSRYVHNVFDLNSEVGTSPLLALRILTALKDAIVKSGDTRTTYIAKADLSSYFLAMGIEITSFDGWLDSLLKKALVLDFDPTCTSARLAIKVEISPSGDLHHYWAGGNYDYLQAMAEVTPIHSEDVFKTMSDANGLSGKAKMKGLLTSFVSYLLHEDAVHCHVPTHAAYDGQRQITQALEGVLRRIRAM
jgi:hypothetical protein